MENYGKVSVQKDCGIDNARQNTIKYFNDQICSMRESQFEDGSLENRIVAFYTEGI